MPDQTPDPAPYELAPPSPTAAPEQRAVRPPNAAALAADTEAQAAYADALENRGVAILGYTIFLVPLLFAAKSRFARYHANQALLLFLAATGALAVVIGGAVVLEFVLKLLPASLGIFYAFFHCGLILIQIVVPLGVLALAIAGIVNAANLEKKPLPLIGHFTLIRETAP